MNSLRAASATHAPATGGRWPVIQPWISLVIRIGLAVVFFWSGIAKVIDIQQSQIAVRAYQILPEAMVSIVGIALPFFELILAVLLLTGLLTRLAGLGSALVMVAFIIGIASAWARGFSIDCGCFGGGGVVSGEQAGTYAWEIARDVGLVLASGFLVIWPWSKFSADRALRLEPAHREAKA